MKQHDDELIIDRTTRTAIVLLLTLLMVVVSGCSRTAYATLFNNSESLLVVSIYDRPEDGEVVKYTTLPGGQIELPYGLLHKLFMIRTGDATHEYVIRFPPKDFFLLATMKEYVKLQFESDGYLYVLHPDAPFPQKTPIIQPEGFPLTPISVTETNDLD
ncbi:MAG: hypothetical protein HQL51_16090 [Magnetococcales bacterium]|nr:hypothetical protein [Magnetococcales bacterium]